MSDLFVFYHPRQSEPICFLVPSKSLIIIDLYQALDNQIPGSKKLMFLARIK
jgi:hypothetical protein